MTDQTITLPIGLLLEIGAMVAGFGAMWAWMKSELKDLRRQVDEHGPDVRKINPLETSFNAFRDEVQRRLSGIEASVEKMDSKVDDMRGLLFRAAQKGV